MRKRKNRKALGQLSGAQAEGGCPSVPPGRSHQRALAQTQSPGGGGELRPGRRAEGSWAHGGWWHGRDQNWAALLGPLKPKRAHQTKAFAPLHAARARCRVKPPGHRKRCRARAKRRALRTRRDPPLTEGRSGKIPLCRRTLPGWKCHQCLALRHPQTRLGKSWGLPRTSCQAPRQGRCSTAWGNTADLRGSQAPEPPAGPTQRRRRPLASFRSSSASSRPGLQHQT